MKVISQTLLTVLVYIAALMCSHMATFRVATNLRIDMTHRLAKLPLGFAESFGSGKLRKTINDASGATEGYLAHRLPDKVGAREMRMPMVGYTAAINGVFAFLIAGALL